MLLKNKNAIVYGGGGAIGGAVARAFAREGAHVFLAGRTLAGLKAVAHDIEAAGGHADCAVLDALNENAIEAHAERVATRAGSIDVALNAVGLMHVQGTLMTELSYDDFAHPLINYTRSNFLTARAVARAMVWQKRGVILTLSTPGSRLAYPGVLGYSATCAAIEAMTRCMAKELGTSGVRVLCLRPDAIPQAITRGSHSAAVFRPVAEDAGQSIDQMLDTYAASMSLLGRLPTLDEVANTAAFMASDQAGAITASVINLSCGSVPDH
jgi:3-oxoacyl-[acyl-carrier protein] reductase